MIFKCEKVDEHLREKFFQEETELREKEPIKYYKTDLDNSDKFWLKFTDWYSDENLACFVIDPIIVHRDTADCIKNRSEIYTWDKILYFALCKDMSFAYALPILKDFLLSYGGGEDNKYYPNFSVKFNF